MEIVFLHSQICRSKDCDICQRTGSSSTFQLTGYLVSNFCDIVNVLPKKDFAVQKSFYRVLNRYSGPRLGPG